MIVYPKPLYLNNPNSRPNPYIQGVEGVEAVGGVRWRGNFGVRPHAGKWDDAVSRWKLLCATDTEKVREVSVKLLPLTNNGIKDGIRIQNKE
jgi:hypothetical protein